MLFNKNDNRVNEVILYKTKPNMLLGCKKAIYGVILLGIVLYVSPIMIKLIGEMQVYMISRIQLPLTRYVAIGFFVVILIIAIYIIWQLVGWYSMEYTLTDSRIIIKSGVISTKKNYMPYATIQDINTSQSVIARLFNVGSVSVFSAYDNNQMVLKNISNPSKVEEIIFSNMVGPRTFQEPPQRFPRQSYPQERQYFDEEDYLGRNDYYDEFEPITPITHESNSYQRHNYEYYPEDLSHEGNRHTYEYEPYGNRYDREVPLREERHYSDRYSQGNYYNNVRDEYSRGDNYPDYSSEDQRSNEPNDADSQEKAIRRHFDKFKK
ncbi:PH domain-containing protein [Methanobrevibacter sp.]|uniref:PH domain-containing protein n=1 Tax=Methanobrevibacter sp. TaxID=66852 RepID=UPI00388EC3D0